MAHSFLEALRKDHDEQRQLSHKFKQAADFAECRRLFQEIRRELKPHVEGEEASFFPRLKENSDKEIRLDAFEKLQEHHVLDLLLKEAQEVDQTGEEFWAKVKVLLEVNEHHIDEEEDETFAAIQDHFSNEELDLLFKQFKEAKEKQRQEMG